MSRPQADPERTCRVARDYQAEFPDPIAVEAGDAFTVSARTSAWEDNPAWMWVWCTDQRGKSGWVPKNIIQMETDGQTGTTQATYNARELTVTAGQELSIEQEESGWFWCCDQQGNRGWVPISHIMVES
ncbi:MAG TPA: SH3 domain-containing protein [Ktedonobacteraceae bacterium]|nr:SH3 domain-containing protein [Ktedonobacteraceae bacterium]